MMLATQNSPKIIEAISLLFSFCHFDGHQVIAYSKVARGLLLRSIPFETQDGCRMETKSTLKKGNA